jgi:hypothetical protein
MRTSPPSTILGALFIFGCVGLSPEPGTQDDHPIRDADADSTGPADNDSSGAGSGGSSDDDDSSGDDPIAADNAEILSSEIPETLACGETVVGEVLVRNIGTDTWSYDEGYKLGAIADSDPFHEPDPRVWLPEGTEVLPGETWLFEIDFVAPTEAGLYTSDWQMVHEYVNWFGDALVTDIAVECDEESSGWVSEACARNGSEICDDEAFYVEPGVRMGLLCSEATGGISFISSNTGPEQSDGMNRCQGWEDNGQDAWDYLQYLESFVCNTPGEIVEVDLSAFEGGDLWFGSHDHPDGGGEMTSTCLVSWQE